MSYMELRLVVNLLGIELCITRAQHFIHASDISLKLDCICTDVVYLSAAR
jgi:hypothetical protein